MESLRTLKDLLNQPEPIVSFEFFPPKTEEMEKNLWTSIKLLEPFNPRFVSVTYGAGGTTRARTHDTVKRIKQETKLTPAAHLTCVGHSRAEIEEIARGYLEIGVNHIVALRGDPPAGESHYTPHPQGYAYASELVTHLRDIGDFEISVAAFPEGHPESTDLTKDVDYLKEKLDAGATSAISQYFFDTEVYLRFIERCRKAGIIAPIEPGILLISNYKQMIKFSEMCKASVPEWVKKLLNGMDEFPEQRDHISLLIAAEQCRILSENGINEFHFYTLNRANTAAALCRSLGVPYKA